MDLASRLRVGIIGVTIWVIGGISICTKPPNPPSRGSRFGVQGLRLSCSVLGVTSLWPPE